MNKTENFQKFKITLERLDQLEKKRILDLIDQKQQIEKEKKEKENKFWELIEELEKTTTTTTTTAATTTIVTTTNVTTTATTSVTETTTLFTSTSAETTSAMTSTTTLATTTTAEVRLLLSFNCSNLLSDRNGAKTTVGPVMVVRKPNRRAQQATDNKTIDTLNNDQAVGYKCKRQPELRSNSKHDFNCNRRRPTMLQFCFKS